MKKKTAAAKPVVAAKAAKPPTLARLQQEVVQLQHQVASLKHSPAPKAKHAAAKSTGKHGTKRGLSLGDVPCCASEAVAASLRLAGGAVADSDVLALHGYAAGGENAAASILAALEAVSERGLAGERPAWFGERHLDHVPLPCGQLLGHVEAPDFSEVGHDLGHAPVIHGLILGLDLPEGKHTVLDDGCYWWSWGEPYDPADFSAAAIEEAWEIRWAA